MLQLLAYLYGKQGGGNIRPPKNTHIHSMLLLALPFLALTALFIFSAIKSIDEGKINHTNIINWIVTVITVIAKMIVAAFSIISNLKNK